MPPTGLTYPPSQVRRYTTADGFRLGAPCALTRRSRLAVADGAERLLVIGDGEAEWITLPD